MYLIIFRSKIFFALNALRIFVHAASQTVAARLMKENVWIPFFVGLVLYCLNIPVLLCIHDPRQIKPNPPEHGEDDDADVTQPLLGARPEDVSDRHDNDKSNSGGVASFIYESIRNAFHIAYYLSCDVIAAPCLAIAFSNEFGHSINNIFQQWMSKAFNLPLADTNYFLSFVRFAGVASQVALSTVVHYLQVKQIPKDRIDLGIVWFSQVVTVLGAIGAATSEATGQFVMSLLVFISGWGMKSALQSHITRVLPQEHITRLYIGLNIAERGASVVGAPLFSWLLSEGIQKGGYWMHLPYWVSTVIFFGVMILTWRFVSLCAGVLGTLETEGSN